MAATADSTPSIVGLIHGKSCGRGSQFIVSCSYRLYRVCDTAGVSFSYRQDVSSTVIRFERPGAQATVAEDGADAEPKTPAVADADAAWGASLGKLGKSKRKAMELAAANGTVSTGALVESAQITRRAASAALKRLSERGLLEWVGKNAHDPGQF